MEPTTTAERTLVLVKPDGVRRGLVGEVIGRLERAGLTLAYLGIVTATRDLVYRHCAVDPAWLGNAGNGAIRSLSEVGIDWQSLTGATDAEGVGAVIRDRLANYLSSGPTVVIVAEGRVAQRKVRQLVGATFPLAAAPGTIRADFGTDDAVVSFQEKRAVENIVHASGSLAEAAAEIALWAPGLT